VSTKDEVLARRFDTARIKLLLVANAEEAAGSHNVAHLSSITRNFNRGVGVA